MNVENRTGSFVLDHTMLGQKITVRECHDLAILDPGNQGIDQGIEFENCTGCGMIGVRVYGCIKENGNYIITIDCSHCTIKNCRIERGSAGEMGIGFFKSDHCIAIDNTIVGFKGDNVVRKSADALCVDYGSQSCKFVRNSIDLFRSGAIRSGYAALNLSYGSGHIVRDLTCIGHVADRPYLVNPCYRKDGTPANADTDRQVVPVTNCDFYGIPKKDIFIHRICKKIIVH